ncbi:MAG: hypothetical protein ABIG44_19180 [Planctomycetota bacterium]
MTTLCVRLTLRSPLGTPLGADTLFGHLCWGIVYHEGADALTELLAQMDGPDPPLVISDPLPAGYVPAPVLPPPASESYDKLFAELATAGTEPVTAHDRIRTVSRHAWLPAQSWEQVAAACDAAAVAQAQLAAGSPEPLLPIPATVAHNTIDRLADRPREPGGLFFEESLYPPHGGCPYDVWVRTSLEARRVEQLFTWALEGGYGRDAGTGKGRLTVDAVAPIELLDVSQPNAVMTLGTCVPAAENPVAGYWNIDVRHGKLGGPWAHDTSADQAGVFKRPVIFLARGAVFHAAEPHPILGRMVHDVHPTRTEVVTYGYTLTLPLRLTEEALPCQPTA